MCHDLMECFHGQSPCATNITDGPTPPLPSLTKLSMEEKEDPVSNNTNIMKSTPSHTRRTSATSLIEAKFRQEFQLSNGRKFSKDETVLLQILYRRLTVDFTQAPAANIEEKISTTCTIENQTIASKRFQDEFGSSRPGMRILSLEYTMRYESKYYNMKHYPRKFLSWMTNNLDMVLSRMQILGINVEKVYVPISRQPHTVALTTQVLEVDVNHEVLDSSVSSSSSSSSSLPSPVALAALTMGGCIDRRKRALKRSDAVDGTNSMNKTSRSLPGRNVNMKPERRYPISKKIQLENGREIRG
eukprot:CAMPEP_0116141756 /NCGR_PEP_ID=MMETSP0329-20121206/14547_1 /TAXON_ID=697910 /ORGANISM="Pseudo-nitzschia arenysensis, Strain B593" /LENGTH=300 /DNA_ID=CAMNT_0003636951 /DNA_START=1 /DNA_END=903 /DNA_ORIENTATION=+